MYKCRSCLNKTNDQLKREVLDKLENLTDQWRILDEKCKKLSKERVAELLRLSNAKGEKCKRLDDLMIENNITCEAYYGGIFTGKPTLKAFKVLVMKILMVIIP